VGFLDRLGGGAFRRRRDGDYDVVLSEDERRLIGQPTGQLRELLGTDSPALARLFPPPYGDDEERNQGYAALAGAELFEGRLSRLEAVADQIDAEVLDEAQLSDWMRSINDVRLVLGTLLDVDDDHEPPPPDSDAAPMFAAYEYFGYLLDRMVRALSD
jgi:hypothetical protein